MNTIKNILLGLALLSILTFAACGGGDSPTPITDPSQEIIDGLEKAWSVTSVTFQNQDVTSDWNGFALTFDTSQGYQATNLSVESILVWPPSGSYSIPNTANPTSLLRSDGVAILVSNLTEASATLTFTISGRGGRMGGKDEGLLGEWVFHLEN